MSEKCILLITNDNRKFMTSETNLANLIEFIKTFNAEAYLVSTQDTNCISDLKKLVEEICNPRSNQSFEFQIIQKLCQRKSKNRNSTIQNSNEIQKFIKTKFLSGESVSLNELKEKFSKQSLTDACLCNHMTRAKKFLCKEGYKFKKIGAGKYCISK